jgi:hypothetical protein
MKPSTQSILPDHSEEDVVLVQAKVPAALHAQTREILKRRKNTWVELIVGAMKAVIEQDKKDRK